MPGTIEELKGLSAQIDALLKMHASGNSVPRIPAVPIELLTRTASSLPALIACAEAGRDVIERWRARAIKADSGVRAVLKLEDALSALDRSSSKEGRG